MRIGSNPVKFDNTISIENYHRIVIPVYIPNFEGYFSDSLKIFKLCLESLLKTIHKKTRITIYSNNCHPDVDAYIAEMKASSIYIDQVFYSELNMGKINAILAASAGNLEPLITISDADVLFLNDWQHNVEKTFKSFPEAGMVSPVPNSKSYKEFTNANWYYGLFKGRLKFEKVKNPEGLIMFNESLGKEIKPLNKQYLDKYLTVKNKAGHTAVMGCGHFVATIRRQVFDMGTITPAFVKIQGGVENKFVDLPNESLGFLRLATLDNYAYHLGNNSEDWMYEKFNEIDTANPLNHNEFSDFINYGRLSKGKIFVGKLVRKIITHKFFKKIVFKYFGMENGSTY